MNCKDTDIAWLAGMIDGEGCLRCDCNRRADGSPRFYPMLSLAMVDWPTIERIRMLINAITGRRVPVYSHRIPAKQHHRQAWVIRVMRNRGLRDLLVKVRPYLVTKQRQALAMLALCTRPTWSRGRASAPFATRLAEQIKAWNWQERGPSICSQAAGTPAEGSETTGGVQSP